MMKNNKPLVSVIVPTYNSEKFLDKCLASIINQTYDNIELIIVDNNSTDKTKEIAKRYTDKVYNKGPERSAQVNYGVQKSKGIYIYKVDSDFVLESNVIKECIDKINEGYDAVCINNEPDVNVSLIAKIRKFETDMYINDLTHSSARFVRKDVFNKIGGFNTNVTAGEDYDFQNKLNRHKYNTGFIKSKSIHLGEPTNLFSHLKKYYIYGKDFVNYYENNKKNSKKQLTPFRTVYFKNYKKFLFNPIMSVLFISYTLLKFTAGGAGFILTKLKLR